jgi:SNF2 family DNA or RNA helicase
MGLLKTRLIAPYQHDGVKWLISREAPQVLAGGFLCDEMGLGKTVQMIATMLANLKPKTLILVPKSIVGQWVSEIKRFGPSLSVFAFDGLNRKMPTENFPNIVVAPYSVLPRNCPLTKVHWDRIILDEGHEIRNPKSKTYIICKTLMADIRWVLSGTPVFNSMRDFVTLCSFVGIPREFVQGYTEKVRETYVLRRTKVDLAQGIYDASGKCLVPGNKRLELPKCDFENLELEMYPEERILYAEVFDLGQNVIRSIAKTTMVGMRQMELLEALLRVRQVLCWPQLYLDGMAKKEDSDPVLWEGRSKKMETLLELIKAHPTEKTLVFCQFTGEMDEIQERLTKLEIPVLRIDGSVLGEEREQRIREFKTKNFGEISPVFIIQIKAGGVGLNLQEATRVYITTPSWNPATELQAIGRAHRTGQTKEVVVRRLVYTGEESLPSVEMSIMQLQEGKAKICAEILNDPRLETVVPNIPKTKINIQTLKKIFAV